METQEKPAIMKTDEFYFGKYDVYGLRTGTGVNVWELRYKKHTYEGTFLMDNMHMSGVYRQMPSNKTYMGQIFCNACEGYGRILYKDIKIFEGLMKDNRRFGPGIQTDKSGSKSIGFWYDCSLIRLTNKSKSIVIPHLAITAHGKVKIWNNKHVWIENPSKDFVCTLGQHWVDNTSLLYSPYCRNPDSLFFDRSKYKAMSCPYENCNCFDKSIIPDHNCCKIIGLKEFKTNTETCGFVVWNRSKLMVEILKHAYKYRESEESVPFKTANLLLGVREEFDTIGSHEQNCIQFLESCATGDAVELINNLRKAKINPDVSDCEGNTGVMYAAASDQYEILKILNKIGASFNCYNDEGLTPLCFVLIKYISIRFEIENWEESFLPEKSDTGIEAQKNIWNSDLLLKNYIKMDQLTPKDSNPSHCYIFKMGDQECTFRRLQSNYTLKCNDLSGSSSQTNLSDLPSQLAVFRIPNAHAVENVKKVITTLLAYGANPNIGQVPLPPMFLALFTLDMDILESMCENGASINATSRVIEGNATPLHYLMLMKPEKRTLKILQLLLKYRADPNVEANVSKYFTEFENISSNTSNLNASPLQFLILRTNLSTEEMEYAVKMFQMLIAHGAKLPDKFLNHSIVLFPILRKNIKIAREILNVKKTIRLQKIITDLKLLNHCKTWKRCYIEELVGFLFENNIDVFSNMKTLGTSVIALLCSKQKKLNVKKFLFNVHKTIPTHIFAKKTARLDLIIKSKSYANAKILLRELGEEYIREYLKTKLFDFDESDVEELYQFIFKEKIFAKPMSSDSTLTISDRSETVDWDVVKIKHH